MNLTNLFENTTPSNHYCDQVAEKMPAGLKSDDDILDAAWDIVVNDLGRTVARNKFMDEDFESDVIGAYKHAHNQSVAEGGPYDLPGIDYPRPGDTPAKPRQRGQSSPGVNPDDEDYFREIFRKKREAAKKAEREQDHNRLATGTNEGQFPDASNSLAKRTIRQAEVPNVTKNADGHPTVQGRADSTRKTYATRVEPTITPTSVKRLGGDRPIPSFLQKEGQEVDASVVVGKLYDIIDHAEDSIKNADFDRQVQYATTVRDRAVKALEMIKQGGNTPEAANAAFKYMQSGNQGVAEADKKKDNDLGSEIRDVGLQRAITRAKSDFPTAGSGIEALAKDFMRSQEQDQKDFEKIRAADKDQERMLSQIAQVDQNQTQEIDNLEQDNTTLKRRLQQIQSVNARLEKTLASMSGRKKEKTTTPADTGAGAFSPAAGIPDAPATATTQTKTKSKTKDKTSAKAQPATSKAIGQIAKTLAPPAPSAAIDQMTQQLQPRQKELDFDNNPVTLKPKKFDTSRATDVVARQPGEVAKDVSKNIGAYGARLSGADRAFNPDAIRNLVAQDEIPMENNKEVKYSNKYQDMVARVGQKAREQEKAKPVDIKDLARRLAAIDARDKVAK